MNETFFLCPFPSPQSFVVPLNTETASATAATGPIQTEVSGNLSGESGEIFGEN